MPIAPILFVTGKGGTGKTTVACSLGQELARQGHRTLIVEPHGHEGAATFFSVNESSTDPTPVTERLSIASWQPRQLVESYFGALLRLPALVQRLLGSSAFNSLTAAAPGVTEFLVLDQLEGWSKDRRFDRIIVDGPATGHWLQLLRTPFQLAQIAPSGPLHKPLKRQMAMLRNPRRCTALIVSLCEEMSIEESADAREVLAEHVGMAVERPVLNRCAERFFSLQDRRDIDALLDSQGGHPYLVAADEQLAAQDRVKKYARTLRRFFGASALRLPESLEDQLDEQLGSILAKALLG